MSRHACDASAALLAAARGLMPACTSCCIADGDGRFANHVQQRPDDGLAAFHASPGQISCFPVLVHLLHEVSADPELRPGADSTEGGRAEAVPDVEGQPGGAVPAGALPV